MATKKLSMAHVATFSEQNKLLIWETLGNRESVALTREEVAALRALIAPAITDEQINELLNELQDVTNAFDYSVNARRVNHHQAVRDWLATLNQSPAPSPDCEGAKEQ